MQKKFQQHTNQYFPFLKERKSLLTISGGIDSVVLAYLCKAAGFDFVLAHCNFNLRGKESDGDEVFVRTLAKELEVEVFVQSFQTARYAQEQKLSIQLACRELRYHWFEELSTTEGFDYILTAHHANDNLETFLINTTRGTGLDGLKGIPAQNGNILRPLLVFSRKEILGYAQKNNIKWREDSSNASDKYFRNKLRNYVIPVLEEENPKLIQAFTEHTQQHLSDVATLLEDYTVLLFSKIVKKVKGNYHISLEALTNTPHIKAVLYQLLKDFGFTEWNDVYSLIEAQSGKQVFSPSHRLLKNRDELILTVNKPVIGKKIYLISEEEEELSFDEGKLFMEKVTKVTEKKKEIAYLSAQKIKYPLKLRKWKAGDFFYPFGMKGKKKLSDFLKDEKCSLLEKENTWVLLSNEEIAWVVGHRIDERFKIKRDNQDIIKITLAE